jgi:hypothetical protein
MNNNDEAIYGLTRAAVEQRLREIAQRAAPDLQEAFAKLEVCGVVVFECFFAKRSAAVDCVMLLLSSLCIVGCSDC